MRKQPMQDRAVQTVERIKRAALQIIAEDGFAAATTNRIAEKAGANIASVYRYFPNRQSIALALYEEASEKIGRLVHQWLIDNMSAPPQESVGKVLSLIVNFIDQNQVVLLGLRDEIPEIRQLSRGVSMETLSYHASELYLQHHFGPIDSRKLRRKLYFIQNFSMGLLMRYVADRPSGLSKKQFIAEWQILLIAYLQASFVHPQEAG